MQSIGSPDYYLKHNFEKAYSDYGVPMWTRLPWGFPRTRLSMATT
jgi:hypothetical protein